MKKLTFTLLLFLLVGTVSSAQTGETEIYECFEKTEKELISLLTELKKKLSKDDRQALKRSQEDWIKFRDSNCNFKSQKEREGGVMANKMFIDCKIKTTELRIEELNDLLINGF